LLFPFCRYHRTLIVSPVNDLKSFGLFDNQS
jgi:hypothetical protein